VVVALRDELGDDRPATHSECCRLLLLRRCPVADEARAWSCGCL
jgi:hypothetical protein